MRIYPLSSYSVGNYCADISAIGPKELYKLQKLLGIANGIEQQKANDEIITF